MEKSFCALIKEALNDEEKAHFLYIKLQQAVEKEYPAEPEKQKILTSALESVKRSEDAHSYLIENLRRLLCEPKED